jgi:adenosylcobinamide-GDP ribazoletransferase
VSGLRTAWIFLTRVPIGDDPRPDGRRAVPWFPVVGAIVGAISGAVWAGANELLPPLPSAAVAITVAALVTGAFHHDGLADMADGFGGGWDREQRLRIMKDSRHGTYGVMAIVCVVAIQVSALAVHGPAQGAAALVAAHTLARAGAIALLAVAPPAVEAGLGSGHADGARRAATVIGVVAGAGIAALALGWIALVTAAVAALAVALCGALAQRKIGGVTGDVLGAAEQVAEAAVLLTTAAFVDHGTAFPFWGGAAG